MSVVLPIRGDVEEDSTFSNLARLCSLDGSGAESAPGEGNLLTVADVASVTCKVFDLGADETTDPGVEVMPTPTTTPAAVIFDTPRTVGWRADEVGYNFRHDLGPAYVADPGEYRLVEYKVTTVTGGVLFVPFLVRTRPVQTS